MNNDFIFDRTRLLLSDDECEKISNAHVLILGTGGVGGYALENIARCGVGTLTIIDGDTVDITNCNRQISALSSTVGMPKVSAWKERIAQINPAAKVHVRHQFLRTPEEIEELFSTPFDFAVDAIDELTPKINFLLALKRRNIPMISAMGAGGKLDPSQVKTADISKTSGCPLARCVRKKLRENGVEKGIKVVYSPEVPLQRFKDRRIGSISFMPAIFGCFCAAAAINSLIKKS